VRASDRPPATDWFEKITLGTLPEQAARRWGRREALVFRDRRLSFADVAAGVDRAARGLIALGVEPGDRVALWMLNRPEWIEIAFAVIEIGAVLVPINTRLRTEDVAYVVDQSGATTLVLAERSGPVDYLGMVRELVPADTPPGRGRLPRLRRLVVLGDARRPATIPWMELLERAGTVAAPTLAQRAAAVDPEDLAFLMYTSGTTGVPKGAMHSHRIVRNVTDRAFRLAITEHDAIMMYLPLFHLFAFSEGMLTSMVSGARQVLTETFDAAESLALIARERATVLHGFDTHYKELCEAHARQPCDVSSVRTGICAAGMSSSAPIARRARALFWPLVSGYGVSEFGVGAAIGSLDSTEDQSCEASGYPAPGYEIRVVDPASGRDQPVDEAGEILVRGYTLMRGYYDKPEATAAAIDAEGCMQTGDMGVLRADGHLRFVGRYKGHAEDRRRERGSDGGGGLPHEPSGYQPGRGGELSRFPAERGRRGVRAVRAGRRDHGGRGHRPLPGSHCQLQDSPSRALRRRLPHDQLRQDPEGQAPRGSTATLSAHQRTVGP
jgi:fatty-acyl-CoA synthase